MIAQTKKPVYGRHSYGAPKIVWDVQADFIVGAFTSIAPDCLVVLGGEHCTDFVTNFPFNPKWTAARKFENTFPFSKGNIVVGSDVWIGQGATLLSGVTIGDGAIIGARAVVASDVPPYAVVIGNPGRVLKYRFNPDQIKRLLAVKWWDWSDEKIGEFLPLIMSKDIDMFLNAAGAR